MPTTGSRERNVRNKKSRINEKTTDSEDDASTTSTRGTESPMTTNNETETEDEQKDPWMPMVEEAMQKHMTAFEEMKMNLTHSGSDKRSAEEKAYFNILSMLQKDLEISIWSASRG